MRALLGHHCPLLQPKVIREKGDYISLCSWFPYLITLGIEYLHLKSAACFTKVKGLQPPTYPSVTHCMHNWLVLSNCENSHITIIFIWASQFIYTKSFCIMRIKDIQHVHGGISKLHHGYSDTALSIHYVFISKLYTYTMLVYQKNARYNYCDYEGTINSIVWNYKVSMNCSGLQLKRLAWQLRDSVPPTTINVINNQIIKWCSRKQGLTNDGLNRKN